MAAIRSAFGASDLDAMAAAVTDEMLTAIAVFGTSAQARELLGARRRLPDLAFAAAPSFMVSPTRQARYSRLAVALLASA